MRKFLIISAILLVFLVQPLASASTPTKSVVYRIDRTWQVPNNSSTTATNLVATIYVFDNRSGWASQQVLSESILLDAGTYETISTADNRVVRASLGTLTPGASRTITIAQVVKVDYVDPGVTASMVQGSVPTYLLQYTQPVANLWESDNPTLAAKALALTENASNLYDKAKQIFDFVKDYLTYIAQSTDHSALSAYNSHVGDCSEFTHLFIALARAAGIPANFVSGYGYKSDYGSNFEQMGHAFAYMYLPNVGWVPIDEVWNSPEGEFCTLSYDHLVLTTSDGTDLVQGSQIEIPGDGTYYSWPHGEANPDISLTETAATLVREVAVEPNITAASTIEGNTWKFTVTVNNVGQQAISNIRIALQADSTYFDVPAAQSISSLTAGNNQPVTFDVGIKASAQNSAVQAIVTYDTSYGTFQAETEVLASPNLGAAGGASNMLMYALIGAVIGLLAAIAAALLLR